MAELNPVNKASTTPGKSSILGSSTQAGLSGPSTITDPTTGGTTTNFGSDDSWMSDINTLDPSTMTSVPGLGNQDLSNLLGSNTDFSSLIGSLGNLTGGGGAKAPAAGTSGGSGSWLTDLISSLGGGAGATGLGPYAATAGIGIYEAKQAQKDAEAKANELKGLGTPLTQQGSDLLKQYNSGTLRPDQQKLVDFTTQQGQNLIQSGTALSEIAQQAYKDYQSGKLPAADEQRLQDQVTSQKQQVRQRLSSAGITDSTILAGQDQQIDNQALQQRQQLLDARFATGNQAYDEWMKSTQAGQELQAKGYQFASQAFETMLNDALGFSTAGMEPVAQSIALSMQSDKELSDSITQLLGNLASAYAYTASGPGRATGGAGGAAGTGGTAGAVGGASGGSSGGGVLGAILGGVKTVGGILGNLFGGNSQVGGANYGTDLNNDISDALGSDDFWGSIGDDGGGFNAAGGGAADLGGLSEVKPTVSKIGMGGSSGVPDTSGSTLGTVKNVAGDIGSLYGAYQGIEQGGAKGYATAANDIAGLAGYNIPALSYAGAADQAAHGDVAGAAVSAISTYLPIAGAGFALAGLANHAFGGGATGQRNAAAWEQETGTQTFAAARNLPVTKLPDGRVIDSKTAMDLADKYWRVRFEGADPSLYYNALASAQSMKGVNLNAKNIARVDTSKGNIYGKLTGPG